MDQTAQKPLIRVRLILATCAFAIALAFVINAAFGDRTLPAVLLEGQPIAAQIGWGVTFGLAISVPSVVVLFFVPLFSSLRRQLLDLVSRLDLYARSFSDGPISLIELAKAYLCRFCLHCRIILGVCVP